jgi:hypothetical protein
LLQQVLLEVVWGFIGFCSIILAPADARNDIPGERILVSTHGEIIQRLDKGTAPHKKRIHRIGLPY